MQWTLTIEDATLGRLAPQELKGLIERECDNLESHIKMTVNLGRKQMGLEGLPNDEAEPTKRDQ